MFKADLMTIPGKHKSCPNSPNRIYAYFIIHSGKNRPPKFVTAQNAIMYDYKINQSQFKLTFARYIPRLTVKQWDFGDSCSTKYNLFKLLLANIRGWAASRSTDPAVLA